MPAALLRLFRAPQRITRHPPAHVLDESRIGRHDGAAVGHAAAAHRPLAENVVFHVGQNVVVVLVFVMVRIHIDDKNVVELALNRLLARMREKPGGVQLVDRYASAAFSEEVHLRLLTFPKRLAIPRGRTRVRL